MKPESDTPRTDSNNTFGQGRVPSELSRQLERELNAAIKAIYAHADRAGGVSPMDVRLPQRQVSMVVERLEPRRLEFQNA